MNERRTENSTDKEIIYRRREVSTIGELLSVWPKIVEHTGLSEYESKVYLCLVALGNSGARKLSLFCDVPRTKVYGTLKKLIDYGLVVEIPGAPKRFVPASPEDAFSAILNIVKRRANDFHSVVQSLVEAYEAAIKESGPQEKIVWYLNDENDIMRKCREIISQSKNKVAILTNADGLSLLFHSTHRLLDDLKERGIDVKLYSPLNPKTNPLARELSYLFEVEKVGVATPVLFLDSDSQRFLLAKIVKYNDERHLKSAIFSDDSTLLQMLSLLLVDEKKASLTTTSL